MLASLRTLDVFEALLADTALPSVRGKLEVYGYQSPGAREVTFLNSK